MSTYVPMMSRLGSVDISTNTASRLLSKKMKYTYLSLIDKYKGEPITPDILDMLASPSGVHLSLTPIAKGYSTKFKLLITKDNPDELTIKSRELFVKEIAKDAFLHDQHWDYFKVSLITDIEPNPIELSEPFTGFILTRGEEDSKICDILGVFVLDIPDISEVIPDDIIPSITEEDIVHSESIEE